MAEAADVSQENEAKKKSVLEDKSKEDLVKIVKKQLVLLQKAKGKSDELNKKCLALKEEKSTALEKQSIIINELQWKVEDLEKSLAELDEIKVKDVKNSEELVHLRENINSFKLEKKALSVSLHEKEEQMQCLSMQLNTMKETCQCFQQELTKLQTNNQELKGEINILREARDAALETLKSRNILLDSRNSEYSVLTDETSDLKQKYSILIEENCSLTSKIDNLNVEMQKLQTENSNYLMEMENSKKNDNDCNLNDFSLLISDNQKLQSEINRLRNENNTMKGNSSFERNDSSISEKNIKSDPTEIQKIREENYELQQNLIDIESKTFKLKNENESLESENNTLKQKLDQLETEKLNSNVMLEAIEKEKLKLKSDVEGLTIALQEVSDHKSGYEYALLQGAPTESLLSPSIQQIKPDLKEKDNSLPPEETKKQTNEFVKHFDIIDPVSSGEALEFGLLSGGNIDDLFTTTDVEVDKDSCAHFKKGPLNDNFDSNMGTEKDNQKQVLEPTETDLRCMYDKLKIERNFLNEEIDAMRIRVDEYSNLLQETISENESLKLKIELCKNDANRDNDTSDFSDAFTNTEMELVAKDLLEVKLKEAEMKYEGVLANFEEKNLDLNKEKSLLEIEKQEYLEKCLILSDKLTALTTEIKSASEKVSNLESSKERLQLRNESLEKQDIELGEKFHRKCSELEECNFQLELMVISIKQGVRQKTSTASHKSEKELHENINLIKGLLDDLIICSNTNAIKVKTLETDLNELVIQRQTLEDELFQAKELNQFLEDEASELRSEVEQLKSIRISSTQDLSDICHKEQYLNKSSALYSIEEVDEKSNNVTLSSTEQNASQVTSTVVLDSTEDTNKAATKQISHFDANKEKPSINDMAVQVNMLLEEAGNQLEINAEVNEEISKYKSIVNSLTSENDTLKCSLSDKSSLVESIHCQMDSLLEKIETVSEELQFKDNDLTKAQCLISELQNKINELTNADHSNKNALKHVKNSLNELSRDRSMIRSNVLSCNALSVEMLASLKESLTETIDGYKEKIELFTKECSHLKDVYKFSKVQFDRISISLEMLSNTLLQVTSIKDSNNLISTLKDIENSFQNAEMKELVSAYLEKKCDKECCVLISDIQLLEAKTQNIYSIFQNYCKTSMFSVLEEIEGYKTDVVPNLKMTIQNLEFKLNEYLNRENNKEEVLKAQEHKVTKNTEESTEQDLKNQLAETEVKMHKFKQIALKMKKELMDSKKQNKEIILEKEKDLTYLDEVRKELENVTKEKLQYVQNYKSLQNEYDKIVDEQEIQRENFKKLEGDFSTTLMELNTLKEKVSDLESQLFKSNKVIDACSLDKQEKEKAVIGLEGKVIILQSNKQENIKKIEELETNIKEKMEKISLLIEENSSIREQLELSQKEGKKKTLLDLEMADFEKSILELNNQIQKKDDEINELKLKLNSELEKVESLIEEIKSTESLKETEEKRADCLKEVLEKTKLDLVTIKEQKAELLVNVSSLQMQLEVLTQQEENYKLQLSEISSEAQNLKEIIKTSSENHQRIVRSLESKISSQKQEILSTHKEVENIKQEFENYKIRVHSVLKQQKSTPPAFAPIDDDLREKMESVVDKLKIQVKDMNEKHTALSMEYETLQEENDTLLQRYNKFVEEREKKDSEWHSRLEQINAEKSKMRSAQEELSAQHLLQNEMLVSTYKKQIKIMSDEHKRTVNELQKQLESADLEIARMQRDQQKTHSPMTPAPQDTALSFDILSQERQEGEGSESIDDADTPIRHLSLATTPTSGFLPFEKLLQTPLESSAPSNFVSYQDWEKMLSNVNASKKKIEHLSEVLNDSESTNLRLSEQVRVLKEEVRRLERNKEREEHAENLEYLKNVFIKFATLQACSEKAMLIPVLTTMLKLSPDEQQQLKNIAGDADTNEANTSGWGNYLHRWSGLA